MRVSRIDLEGFGCLREFREELAPGFNLFFGDNEAGKSTLQQAVCALIYGFYDADRVKQEETDRHKRFAPWNGDRYRGSLEYSLEDGRRFEVRRDFSTADVYTQLIDLTTGRDLAPEFGLGRHGNVPFARKHLGMPRSVFQGVAFISQGEVFAVTDSAPRQIGDAISSLADSARRDVSAARAIERLDAAFQKVGSDRARTAELPKARAKLAEAQAEIQHIDSARASVARQAQELEGLDEALRTSDDEMRRTEYLLARAREGELRKVLGQLRDTTADLEVARETEKSLKQYENFPARQRNKVAALEGRVERAREVLDASRSELAAASVPEDELLEYEILRQSVGKFSREQLAGLEARAYAVDQRRGMFGAIRAALTAAARAFGKLLARLIRRRPSQDEAPEEVAVSVAEAQAMLERHRRYLELRPGVEDLHRTERQFREAASAVEAIESELSGLLGEAGIRGTHATAVQAFLEGCSHHDRFKAAVDDVRELERRRGILLAGRSERELNDASQECARRAEEIAGADPGIAGATGVESAEALARRFADMRTQQGDAAIRAATLRQEVEMTLSRHRSRAEAEEDLQQSTARVVDLERKRSAISLAKETLERAMADVYRDFAPAVNTFLSSGIEFITDGRYQRAQVDPATLQISMLVPETGRQLADPPVSHGTRTVAYVLMRIGLAQHMSRIGEPVPLVLDDPFVDVDASRLERVLEFLDRLSVDTQVLFFTKDAAVLDWFRAHANSERDALHMLNRPALTAALL